MEIKDKDENIIRAIYDKGRLSLKEIADTTDIHKSTLSWRLELLMAAGYVLRASRGIYELTEDGEKIVRGEKNGDADE